MGIHIIFDLFFRSLSMKGALKIVIHGIIIFILTITTQVGGVIWLISIILAYRYQYSKRISFPILYLISNLIIVPLLAPQFGRVPLPVLDHQYIKPKNIIYPLLFRNYVSPTLKTVLINSANDLNKNNIQITYLDACFPFINKFPLLPHLSHNDGKKIDLCFLYKDTQGTVINEQPSLTGYGFFEAPTAAEINTTQRCKNKGYIQYDYNRFLCIWPDEDLKFDARNTKRLIATLINDQAVEKLFIEPHLKARLGFNRHRKVRFHGCGAVRHDDHIHLQVH